MATDGILSSLSTSTSVSGSTLVSSTAVFADTRANTSLYTAGGIPETLDQPTTITSYYLHKITGSDTSYTLPFFINTDNNIQIFAEATFESLLQEWIRHTAAASTDGYKLSYSYTTGNNRGTGMTDTKLDGSGNYQTRFVNANDYRAQEFPNGTAQTQNTYYLKNRLILTNTIIIETFHIIEQCIIFGKRQIKI